MNDRLPLIVGLGSSHGDDQVGWRVAELLQDVGGVRAEVRRATQPSDILDWLAGVTELYVCDACQTTAGTAGQIHRWSWPDVPREVALGRLSSHGVSLVETLSLAAQLGTLPAKTVIWAVDIAAAAAGTRMCAEVEAAADCAATHIAQEVLRPPAGRLVDLDRSDCR